MVYPYRREQLVIGPPKSFTLAYKGIFQFAFQPAGFSLAMTLSAESADDIVVASTRSNRDLVLVPGVAAALGAIFEMKLTAASSPEELLRQLEAAQLSFRRKT